MDALKNLPREVQFVLGGGLLYLIVSFLNWQQASAFGISVGRTEWVGVGVVAGLLIVALLLWEAARFFAIEIPLGTLSAGFVSLALALLLVLFTVLTFLTHNEARHWPSWVGLLLSFTIAGAAVVRAKAEGVHMPEMTTGSHPVGGRHV
ncbi:MAG: hypothetical protein WCH31_07595 [Actinomycetes bacterium]